ncbi:nucleoside phosphorylase [Thermococcus paralvinellae]|uniref:Uridine phosphorylase n=1 Tax=Thermococcus paralvinellae TaxID=582419 RepID=W0I7E4_9EURY|nr:nucleoside phosphorylase [Thermococcus paralvinellae]AHF80667.1 Uridine phosphorylase [Thermococcus paralvinellae]
MWLGKGREIIKPPGSKTEKEPYEKYLIVFTDIAANYAKQLLNDVELKEECTYVRRAFVGEYKGKKIYVLNPYFGSPASVFALEIAIAQGGKEFLVVGEAGAIKEGVTIGDVILPTWALREEGTSYHYMPPDYIPKPSERLFNVLEKEVKHQIGRKRISVFKGGIWTTDAPFRETEDKVREYSNRGILGVEMETSALMSVASFRRVDLAVALAVSDELYKEKWNPGFGSGKLKRTEKLLVKAALGALVSP